MSRFIPSRAALLVSTLALAALPAFDLGRGIPPASGAAVASLPLSTCGVAPTVPAGPKHGATLDPLGRAQAAAHQEAAS